MQSSSSHAPYTSVLDISEGIGSTSPTFIRLLTKKSVQDVDVIPNSGVIVYAKRDDLVVNVLRVMSEYNFLTVPVLDSNTEDDSNNHANFIAFIDQLDLILWILNKMPNSTISRSEQSPSSWHQLQSLDELKHLTVQELLDSRDEHNKNASDLRNKYHPIRNDYSLFAAFEVMARERNVHRIPILNANDNSLTNLITQGNLLQIIHNHMCYGNVGSVLKKTIAQCHAVPKQVFCVSHECTAFEAFESIVRHQVSAVAIVHCPYTEKTPHGRMVGVISVRDMKRLTQQQDLNLFELLQENVMEFIRTAKGVDPSKLLLTVTEDATLETVIEKMHSKHVHRIFVVNEMKHPVGVVSVKDVIRIVLDS